MDDTTPLEPKDAEIDSLWEGQKLTVPQLVQRRAIARAVLAKWGQPSGAGEPVAWVDERAIFWLANRRSGAATITTTLGKQKSFERPMPLYTTPHPTQAQVGAVPMSHEAAKALVLKYGNDPLHLVLQVERHHGIKAKEAGNAE